jgi:hypothetical protein
VHGWLSWSWSWSLSSGPLSRSRSCSWSWTGSCHRCRGGHPSRSRKSSRSLGLGRCGSLEVSHVTSCFTRGFTCHFAVHSRFHMSLRASLEVSHVTAGFTRAFTCHFVVHSRFHMSLRGSLEVSHVALWFTRGFTCHFVVHSRFCMSSPGGGARCSARALGMLLSGVCSGILHYYHLVNSDTTVPLLQDRCDRTPTSTH